MRSFRYTEHINRPPADVFAFMMDFNNAPRWRSLIRRMEVVGSEPLHQGSQLLLTIDVQGKVKQMVSEVWSYDPPRRVGYRNTAVNVTGTFEYVLEPDGDGTRIALTCDVRPHGFMWLLLPLLIRSNRARYADQLRNLKREVESGSAR
jgi:carbon monoxide dehydrogenase subunit G